MRHVLTRLAIASVTVWGCASPQPATDNSGNGGSQGSGSGGTQGSGNGGSSATGAGGIAISTGGSSATGTGGSAGGSCTPAPDQLINSAAWNCDLATPIMIQGAIYGYGDGSSCATPIPANVCSTGKCCMAGTTVVDATSAKWGCGI